MHDGTPVHDGSQFEATQLDGGTQVQDGTQVAWWNAELNFKDGDKLGDGSTRPSREKLGG